MLNQRFRVVLALLLTGLIVHFVPNRPAVALLLAIVWTVVFYPIAPNELIVFVLAGMFFLVQNYICLKAGLFEFKFKDIFLMPYYEPLLWGFYYVSMKRFLGSADNIHISVKSIAGLVATSIAFSVFSFDPRALFVATACSTAFLFLMFHSGSDLQHAVFGLMLGCLVELFGVHTGLWRYPAPDFVGIPFWFATMWLSVGLLGYRFLFPAAQWLAVRR